MRKARQILDVSNGSHTAAGHCHRLFDNATIEFGSQSDGCAAIGVLKAELSGCVSWITGGDGTSKRSRSEEADHVLHAVVKMDIEDVSLLETTATKCVRSAINPTEELVVPDRLTRGGAMERKLFAVARPVALLLEEIDERGDAEIDLRPRDNKLPEIAAVDSEARNACRQSARSAPQSRHRPPPTRAARPGEEGSLLRACRL